MSENLPNEVFEADPTPPEDLGSFDGDGLEGEVEEAEF